MGRNIYVIYKVSGQSSGVIVKMHVIFTTTYGSENLFSLYYQILWSTVVEIQLRVD